MMGYGVGFDTVPEDYYWCLHCQCVWSREEWEKRDLACPGAGCDGGAFDMLRWSKVRRDRVIWPAVPVSGSEYRIHR